MANIKLSPPRTIGERVRTMRLSRGWTQVKLAEESGIGQSAISSIETGSTKWLRGGNLLRIAAALAVHPRWLQTGAGDPQAAIESSTEDAILHELARQLSPQNRAAWIAAGTALLDSQAAAALTPGRPFRKVAPPV